MRTNLTTFYKTVLSKTPPKVYVLILAAIIIVLFSFLRLYNINQSLLFFNDTGRDLLVLHTWLETGKPPLLGPQNSLLPFNQSPFYFYLLMPFYLLLGKSLTATVVASLAFHLAIFMIGLGLLFHNPRLRTAWLILWFIYAITPQLVMQHRYIWNPSLVAACISLSFFSLVCLKERYSRIYTVVFGLSLSLAVGFSYSVVPTLLMFLVSLFFLFKGKQLLEVLTSLGLSLVFVHSPIVIFELRHNFTLLGLLSNFESQPTVSASMIGKAQQQLRLILQHSYTFWIVTAVLCLVGYQLRQLHQLKQYAAYHSLLLSCSLCLANLLFLMFLPVNIEAHFIFGVFSLFFISISLINPKLAVLIVLLLSLEWLSPRLLAQYFKPAWRTPEETINCAKKICTAVSEPVYVSVQSNLHNYHAAPEFRFLFDREGCNVINLEQPSETPVDTMLVVADGGEYTHGSTQFNELTVFGQSVQQTVIACQPGLNVYVLKRATQ